MSADTGPEVECFSSGIMHAGHIGSQLAHDVNVPAEVEMFGISNSYCVSPTWVSYLTSASVGDNLRGLDPLLSGASLSTTERSEPYGVDAYLADTNDATAHEVTGSPGDLMRILDIGLPEYSYPILGYSHDTFVHVDTVDPKNTQTQHSEQHQGYEKPREQPSNASYSREGPGTVPSSNVMSEAFHNHRLPDSLAKKEHWVTTNHAKRRSTAGKGLAAPMKRVAGVKRGNRDADEVNEPVRLTTKPCNAKDSVGSQASCRAESSPNLHKMLPYSSINANNNNNNESVVDAVVPDLTMSSVSPRASSSFSTPACFSTAAPTAPSCYLEAQIGSNPSLLTLPTQKHRKEQQTTETAYQWRRQATTTVAPASSPTPSNPGPGRPRGRRLPVSGQKARNRVAAAKCREKARSAIERLAEKEPLVYAKNAELKAVAADLRAQALSMHHLLLRHTQCDCVLIQEYLANRARQLVASSQCSDPAGSKEGMKDRDERRRKGSDDDAERNSERRGRMASTSDGVRSASEGDVENTEDTGYQWIVESGDDDIFGL